MNTKNMMVTWVIVSVVIGIGIGLLISLPFKSARIQDGTHMMPNGHMMSGGNMSMGDMMGSMTAGLSGKTGDEFDKAFLDEMIVHHEGAVAMAKEVLRASKREELRQLAQDIVSAQTKEIGMMKVWRESWFK
jgi:uncharacterized protein (DUF305 family)